MAIKGDYKKLYLEWLTKTHSVGSPELDALIDISINSETPRNDTANVNIIEINSETATTISIENPNRISFSACLPPYFFDLIDLNIIIRYYPAAQDNILRGDVLTRVTAGDNNLFRPVHKMNTDNIYTGEISAISASGTHDLHITEY